MATLITEYSPIESEFNEEEKQEMAFAKRGCCLCIPCFSRKRSSGSIRWQRIRPEKTRTRWWSKSCKAVKKVKEWSELVAGPKWKTLIRRLNKNISKNGNKFQYDPLSYSLNFDEGPGADEVDDDRVYRDFSMRYASIPMSAKSSMDIPSFSER